MVPLTQLFNYHTHSPGIYILQTMKKFKSSFKGTNSVFCTLVGLVVVVENLIRLLQISRTTGQV